MRQKIYLLIVIFTISTLNTPLAYADKGMWLPNILGEKIVSKMQAKGLKLSAQEIYDINQASLKDAVVRFQRGCTGEIISDQGLMITNHHCGYSQIQNHSAVENDYLTDGFVARDRAQELPNPDLKVYLLQEMRDVTSQILSGDNPSLTTAQRDTLIAKNTRLVVKRATRGTRLEATVEPLYYGNAYYLYIYKVFEDVRLVMAPASSIGRFGGDTDNWMWPRHSGDFAIFRIYADADNNPAPYASTNIPYKPAKSLTISLAGLQAGDFTMVYGYPAKTQQYLHSAAIKLLTEELNPAKIALRARRLDIMNAAQAENTATRIKYAAKNASVSNMWKKWQGELLGLQRLGTVDKKIDLEKRFTAWAESQQDNPEYLNLPERLEKLYDAQKPYTFAKDIYTEAPLAVEILKFASEYPTKKRSDFETFYKNYDRVIDSTTAGYLLSEFVRLVPDSLRPAGVTPNIVAEIFENSIFLDSARLRAASTKVYEADPVFRYAKMLTTKQAEITKTFGNYENAITLLYRDYMRGLMAMDPDSIYFPDANRTLRVAYGQVEGYSPRDAIYHAPLSTLDGVMQKDNPEIYDYDVPEALREIYRTKNYGRWAVNGTVPVAFIATNHTTGGNSGSPVLNSRGELIGVNFDRTWQGTMSDLEFDPTMCRNIALDIRYAMFLIDKLYGAGYLLEEIKFVK